VSLTIGVDVGGTKIAAGVVDEKGDIKERVKRPTPAQDGAGVVKEIIGIVNDFKSRHDVTAVGLGVAAQVDSGRSTVYFAPNIAWRNVPVGDEVMAGTGLPTVVENDANAATWGEYRFGLTEDVATMILLTVGTGMGGGVVIDGRLFRGAHGVGTELGHLRVAPDGQLCGCGLRGCLEAHASGTALGREARAAAATPAGEHLRAMAGGDPQAVTGPMVTAAALEGDPLSIRLISNLATWLGHGMAAFTALFDPAMFVINSGLAEAGDVFMRPLDDTFRQHITGHGHRPEPAVRFATLGDDAGLIGAADLARL
jgi:glucokinase